MAQYAGVVRWFNNAKGYGFLGRDEGADVFVHFSSTETDGYKSLKEGEEVEYDVVQGERVPKLTRFAASRSEPAGPERGVAPFAKSSAYCGRSSSARGGKS